MSGTPDAPALARKELKTMGPLSRNEWIVAVTFAVMVTGWVMADKLHLSLTAVAFAGLGVLLATNVLTLAGHQPAGRHAGHLPLARRALRAERSAQ